MKPLSPESAATFTKRYGRPEKYEVGMCCAQGCQRAATTTLIRSHRPKTGPELFMLTGYCKQCLKAPTLTRTQAPASNPSSGESSGP